MNFFDLHCDTAYRCYNENLSFDDGFLSVTPSKAKIFDKWYQCFAIFVKDGTYRPFDYYKNVLNDFKSELKNKPQNLTPLLTVENGIIIENDLSRIEVMHNHGVKALTLTWNGENQIAGGADTDIGLKNFGKEVILQLNRHNIMTDLSHLNKKSFYSVLELADIPIVTHSCLQTVCKHKRNIDDNQLKALVQRGGIFGLCFYPVFLGNGDVFENIYKNIFHILDLGYEDYLSLGSDFDGADMNERLKDISFVPKLYKYLKFRNINDNILNKIFFENAYRFFKKGKII